PVIESVEAPLELVPDLLKAVRFGRERATSLRSIQSQPSVRSERTIGSGDVPDPVHVRPTDRFALAHWMLANDLLFRDDELVDHGRRLRKPRRDDGDQETETEKNRNIPAEFVAGAGHPNAAGGEERRGDRREQPRRSA